ncbi:hypothetical protein PVW53_00425 [Seohaeicola sp. SP36]|uniref:hypothetical protein n=1 Tax=unclassified Seohaeicola TaxID=2641111 RepID=UPI00237C0740|nr:MULTISPECIES: hypothetical protein [unclassified Seohaeicola]MDD9706405.1 hypothetical protein [Seohaeicola sp. 4SK31]MDD9733968.1 hypothetical protein [Seohaeicola sp. SP36]
MKALILCGLSLILLAACGVEGAPVRPSLDAGVSVTRGGIYPSASVGLNKGPVSLRVGL